MNIDTQRRELERKKDLDPEDSLLEYTHQHFNQRVEEDNHVWNLGGARYLTGASVQNTRRGVFPRTTVPLSTIKHTGHFRSYLKVELDIFHALVPVNIKTDRSISRLSGKTHRLSRSAPKPKWFLIRR